MFNNTEKLIEILNDVSLDDINENKYDIFVNIYKILIENKIIKNSEEINIINEFNILSIYIYIYIYINVSYTILSGRRV